MAISAQEREFDFTRRDFDRVRELIFNRVGITLHDSKHHMVYSRLARRLRALNIDKFNDYLELLNTNHGPEWEHFVNALTTNLTSFFREAHHFEELHQQLKNWEEASPTIWCSASSTGEEPYSIAITACEAFNKIPAPVHIIASDVDTNVLAKAQSGVYGLDRVEGLKQTQLRSFFMRGTGQQEGLARVRAEVRNMIAFRQLNLLEDDWAIRGGLAAIFCRNVMIYFDKPTQKKIIERFVPLLHPKGLLYVGHSESLHQASEWLEPIGRTVYRLKNKRPK